MNKRRLLKLADLLDADAKNKKGIRFDMRTWGRVDDPEAPLSCGTQACAMGLAALSGAFKRAGLTASIVDGRIRFKWNGRSVRDGFKAARKVFQLTLEQSMLLFAPKDVGQEDGAAGERAKAKEIRKFVDTGEL